MATVFGKGVTVNDPGVVADGGSNTEGLRSTGFWGVKAIGTNTGVIAEGLSGVAAFGEQLGIMATGKQVAIDVEGGIGIKANGTTGPAGSFRRKFDIQEGAHPQIHIQPQPMWVPDPVPAQGHEIIPQDNPDILLPVFAQAGDLLVTGQTVKARAADSPPNAEATLWFCVVGNSTAGPAVWKQVLLGPGIVGRNQGKG